MQHTPDNKQQLCNACIELFLTFIDDVTGQVFESVPERLIDAGLQASSLSESSQFIKLAKDIDSIKPAIAKTFKEQATERVCGTAEDRPEIIEDSDSSVLELVDEEKFDDWLKVLAIIKSIESEFWLPMIDFEARYGTLTNQSLDRQNNPFGPRMICQAFQDALQDMELNNDTKAIFYTALKTSIKQLYAGLLQEMGEVLKDIVPRVEAKPLIERRESQLQQNRTLDSTQQATSLFGTDSANNEQSFSSFLELHGQQPLDTRAFDSTNSNSHPQKDNSMLVLSRLTAALNKAQQILGSRDHDFNTLDNDSNASSESQPQAATEEIVSAIQNLAAGSLTRGKSPNQSTAEIVQRLVSTNAGQPRSLAVHQAEALNGAARLFTRARSEYDESSDIDSLLKRLERPILKLMLKDNDFMVNDKHPAREVVNLTDQFSMAADSKGHFKDPKLQRFLAIQVDLVDREFPSNPDVFITVRDKLEKVIVPIRKARKNRMFRVQQRYESQQVVRNAKERVDAYLESRLGGQHVPTLLLQILELGWRQYFVLLQLNPDTSKRKYAASIMDSLIARLAQKTEADFDDAGLVDAVMDGLTSIGNPVQELQPVRAALINALSNPVEDQDFIFVPNQVETQVKETKPSSLIAIEIGDWWQFYKDNRWVPMQLVWKSRNNSILGFTDRSASEQFTLTMQDLISQVNERTASENEKQSLPLMERSEYALFDESYRDLIHQALHDPVTGLANRKALLHRMNRDASYSDPGTHFCLCQIEFDQTRVVYGNCGADAGDKLLNELSAKINTHLTGSLLLSFTNTETFILLLPDTTGDVAHSLAEKILQDISDYRFEYNREIYSIGLNIGIVEYDPTLIDTNIALRQADSACLTSKSHGRNNIVVYETQDAQLQAQESLKEWAGRIDRIIENDGLYLRCQKIVAINDNSEALPYYEILLGIIDKQPVNQDSASDTDGSRANISPVHFFPAVESWKRSHEIDLWVLSEVFGWIRGNRALFDITGGFSINLSGHSLNNAEVLNYLRAELATGDLPLEKITFEITETAAIESYAKAQEFISEVVNFGCKFSLDDFGAGFSSYSHLKNLKVHTLKIDGSFVKGIIDSPADLAMVKSMNEIAHFLGMKTVAEYVETPLILEKLREIGVDFAQGYAVHIPTAITELEYSNAQQPLLH